MRKAVRSLIKRCKAECDTSLEIRTKLMIMRKRMQRSEISDADYLSQLIMMLDSVTTVECYEEVMKNVRFFNE